MILAAQFIGKIRQNLLRGRVVEPKMVVEPPRPVDQVIVQTVQAVAGDDKQLFALSRAVEQAEQPGLCLLYTSDAADER